MDLLARAEELVSYRTPPPRGKASKSKSDPLVLENLATGLASCTNAPRRPTLLESSFRRHLLNWRMPAQREPTTRAGPENGHQQKFRAKKAVLDFMCRAILERKGAFERVQGLRRK